MIKLVVDTSGVDAGSDVRRARALARFVDEIWVDVMGVGFAVADRLRDSPVPVHTFNRALGEVPR